MIPRVAGRGQAVRAARGRFDAPAVAAVRYADPASWITAAAIASAMEPVRDEIAAHHDRVGLVVTSADGPVEAIAAIRDAARSRSSSPIRFPASNPGSLAGIPCIAFGLRGPTLVLTLPADRGAPPALLLAEAWIAREVAAYVIVAACGRAGDGPVARAIVLGAQGEPFERGREAAWLASRSRVAEE
jgi:hypothetical protein